MRCDLRSALLVTLAASTPAGLFGCGSDGGNNTIPVPMNTAGSSGGGSRGSGSPTAGSGGSSGGSAGTAGASGTAGMSGGMAGAPAGGAGGGITGDAGVPEAGQGGGDAGTPSDAPPVEENNWMGFMGVKDLSKQRPTSGCGKAPDINLNTWVPFDTDVPVPEGHDGFGGDGRRRYFVKLPSNYDPSKVYKVLVAGSSCVPSTGPMAMGGLPGGVIQITPEVERGVMVEGYHCYDDKDPRSIEYPFVEKFLQEVGGKFCYDQNKVFVQGHSSGGWYSNMIGCVYGSTLVRAISSNGGGIPDDAVERPNCSETPTPGMWIHPRNDNEQPNATRRAIGRALRVNKCQGAGEPGDISAWETAPSEDYTAGGAQNCKKYMCPEAFPIVFCQPPGGHGPVGWHAQAAWTFFDSLP